MIKIVVQTNKTVSLCMKTIKNNVIKVIEFVQFLDRQTNSLFKSVSLNVIIKSRQGKAIF